MSKFSPKSAHWVGLLSLLLPINVAAEALCTTAVSAPQPAVDQSMQTGTLAERNDDLVIEADEVKIDADNLARFSGNVSIEQGDKSIRADQAQALNNNETIVAQGNIHFQQQGFSVSSEKMLADMTNNQVSLQQTYYELANGMGHGDAQEFIISEQDQGIRLTNGNFTVCPPGEEPDWQLHASEIFLSAEDEWGESWHNRIEVAGMPVLYLPYFSFPLTDKRKSGLLLPKITSSSKNGVDIIQPYYWNIAENLDMTTSLRAMTKRGNMLKNELRYLNQAGLVELYTEWMSSDDEYINTDGRGGLNLTYQGHVWDNWQSSVDITSLSDDSYLTDFGFRGYNRVDTHVESLISLYQLQENWYVEINLRQFEVFGEHDKPYKTLPEIRAEYSNDTAWDNLTYRIPMEAGYFSLDDHFSIDDEFRGDAFRFHAEPTLSWQLTQPAWEFTAESTMLATTYVQEQSPLAGGGEETLTRTMPRVRLNTRVILERPIDWFGKDMTQTLEPRVQYLWVPYRNQRDIGFYDTALLQDDFYGLFRASRFSGIDRIIEANQITIGATSRLINNRNQEKLQLSVGQIFYLTDPTVDLIDQEVEIARGESALAIDLDADIRNRWFLHYGLQYDTELERTNKSHLTLDYRLDDDHLVQLSHRFARDVSDATINMAGAQALWNIDNNWQIFGTYYRDFKHSRKLEARLGFEYSSCCWGIQFAWQSKLLSVLEGENLQTDIISDEYDRGFMLSFTMGGIGRSKSAQSNLLQDGIFSYRRPYFLNQ